jgi:N-methylhydantoinase A
MFQRETLGSGIEIEGPAVIAEYSATTWVPAGWTATVDRVGSLHLSR